MVVLAPFLVTTMHNHSTKGVGAVLQLFFAGTKSSMDIAIEA
jgi:hypothetical protein